MYKYECPLCCREAQRGMLDRRSVVPIDCDTCGRFFITQEALEDILSDVRSSEKRARLSGVTRERSDQDSPITICSSGYDPKGEEPIGVRIDEVLDDLAPRSIP